MLSLIPVDLYYNPTWEDRASQLKEIKTISKKEYVDKLDCLETDLQKELFTLFEYNSLYNYDEIEELIKPIFMQYNIKVNKTSIGRHLNPITDKKRRMVDGVRQTIYSIK